MDKSEDITQKEEIAVDDNQEVGIDVDIKSEILKISIPPQITALMDAARNGAPFCEEIAEIKEELELCIINKR